VEAGDFSYSDLSQVLRSLAQAVERKEQSDVAQSFEQRRLTSIHRLLAGEQVDATLLNLNLESFHVGIVVTGPQEGRPLAELRQKLDSRILVVSVDELTTWIWLGGDRQLLGKELKYLRSLNWPEEAAVACGEPAEGLEGWRLTHRQAVAALPVAEQDPARVVYYSDVALLTAALHDDRLASSLRQTYLEPLAQGRDGGVAAKDTLRAYFRTARNATSAAAILGIDRATVRNRLNVIEERLGRSPEDISAELEVALRLDEIKGSNMVKPIS
jgi:DNA-binding PucR family transcriptional regulator